MNIIEAREAAMAGKTVIGPNGSEFSLSDLENRTWLSETVFGEWSIKQEPVVFEAEVGIANETLYGPGIGRIASKELRSLLGKRVKVTVEVIK